MARPATRVLAREFTCYVRQRDDICWLLKFKEDAKGQDVMDEICDRLGIIEKDYFGLQYANGRGEMYWLNMRNRIVKQLNKQDPHLLFCVKFYVQPHQLLQQSSRQQFFLNMKYEILYGRYDKACVGVLARLHALIAQVEAGSFKENHISYNPSRVSHWDPDFCSQVIIEHCKLKDMTPEVAEFFCLKEVAELDDYGMEYCQVKTEDTNVDVLFGIGIDCLQIERTDGAIQRIPYSCLHMAINSGKTVKLDIYTDAGRETESIIYRLGSKEAACSLYRSITEHHAFYKCDSVLPAVKEQVSRDFFDTFLSWFHDDNADSHTYIFDTERTCREAYDNARRILYNFGSSSAVNLKQHKEEQSHYLKPFGTIDLNNKVNELSEDLHSFKEAFYCPICCDNVVDIVLQCGHLICSTCGEICQECPFCRTNILSKTKFYMPVAIMDGGGRQEKVQFQDSTDKQNNECLIPEI